MAALYQPLKRLATIVTPRWGFVLQLVSILLKLQSIKYKCLWAKITDKDI